MAQEALPVESPAPAKVPAQTVRAGEGGSDALGAAKRDLDAVRQSRMQGTAPGERALPRFAVPDLNSGAGAGGAGKQEGAANRPASPARLGHDPNWLVEGASRGRDEDRRRLERRGRERQDDEAAESRRANGTSPIFPEASVRAQNRDDQRRGAPSKSAEQSAADRSASNPLNPFLADWMSSSDYTLLAARGTAAGAVRETGSGPNGISAGPEWLATLGTSDLHSATAGRRPGTAGANPSRPAGPAATQPVNPFLAALEGAGNTGAGKKSASTVGGSPRDARGVETVSSAGLGLAAQPTLPATIGASSGPSFVAPASPTPTATPVPDFAKPKSDEKLFKPLKRF